MVQALTLDALRRIEWMLGGSKKRYRPESLAAKLLDGNDGKNRKTAGYASGEDFKKAWKELTGNG